MLIPHRSVQSLQNKRIQLIVYISILLAATLLFAFVPNVSGLMAGRLLHGLGASGVWTVAMALLNDSVSSQRVGRMTGFAQVGYAVGPSFRRGVDPSIVAVLMHLRLQIGNSVSPTMGGALYAKLGWLPLCYFALALGTSFISSDGCSERWLMSFALRRIEHIVMLGLSRKRSRDG